MLHFLNILTCLEDIPFSRVVFQYVIRVERFIVTEVILLAKELKEKCNKCIVLQCILVSIQFLVKNAAFLQFYASFLFNTEFSKVYFPLRTLLFILYIVSFSNPKYHFNTNTVKSVQL